MLSKFRAISYMNSCFLMMNFQQVFLAPVPDLSSKGPLVLSGRYRGVFPETFKAKGVLADLSSFSLDLKAIQAKDIPLDKVNNCLRYKVNHKKDNIYLLNLPTSSQEEQLQ